MWQEFIPTLKQKVFSSYSLFLSDKLIFLGSIYFIAAKETSKGP